ncbi:MAG: hypothetical protein JWM27_3729 [Gemmatimonadetes bacterium]|nr:hypothetical protein [Gemmatimonadota bacterium]
MTDSAYDAAPSPDPRPFPVLAKVGLALAAVAGLLLLVSGPGTRAGVWSFITGLTLFKYGAYLAVPAAVVCLAAALVTRPGTGRRGFVPSLAAALAIGAAFAFVFVRVSSARGAPPIHDITTDTKNPPAFVAVLPARRETALNPLGYEGDSVAALQVKAFPDVKPVMLALSPDSAFAVALGAAKAMGWEVVDANRGEGRIEATDRTFWFGFADDVVIRVMPASGISRVDVRSESRVGRGDAGTNAARVRAYLARLKPYAAVAG